MNDTTSLRSVQLRRAVAGLLSFAAAEEQALLAAAAFCPDYDRGSPDRWAAVPVVAHNNQFKSQQAERISAIRSGQLPAVYGEVDHSSPRSIGIAAPSRRTPSWPSAAGSAPS